MVGKDKLLLLAATINKRGDHQTTAQKSFLEYQEKLHRESRAAVRASMAKAREERMRAIQKPEFSVPELEEKANEG